MANLWSGRFSSEPDPTAFQFGSSFRFDRRLFEDDVDGQPCVGRGARGRRRVQQRRGGDGGRRSQRHPRSRPARAGVRRRPGRRRACIRRAAARRARRRSRQAAAHGTFAQRAGVARSAPLSQAADSASAAAAGRGHRRAREEGGIGRHAVMPSYTHLRRAMPVLVVALFSGACRGAAARLRPSGLGVAGGRRDAARLRRRRRHQLRDRYGHAGVASRIFARRRQQHRRFVRSRFRRRRSCMPAPC